MKINKQISRNAYAKKQKKEENKETKKNERKIITNQRENENQDE